VFRWLASAGGVTEPDMLRTFNCGVGRVAVVAASKADAVNAVHAREGEKVVRLGEVVAIARGAARVGYRGRLDLAW
jgi:phosphoribosylformylglycinamidine cyclo-ligase